MKWFNKFKDRLRKNVIAPNSAYLDFDDPVIIIYPNGREIKAVVTNPLMYENGWKYVLQAENNHVFVLSDIKNQDIKNPVQIKIFNPIEGGYFLLDKIFDIDDE